MGLVPIVVLAESQDGRLVLGEMGQYSVEGVRGLSEESNRFCVTAKAELAFLVKNQQMADLTPSVRLSSQQSP